MPIQDLRNFGIIIKQDEDLQNALKQTKNDEEFINRLVELGKEAGFNFTKEEVVHEINQVLNITKRHLTDEELDSLAVGGNYNALFGTSAWTFKDCGAY